MKFGRNSSTEKSVYYMSAPDYHTMVVLYTFIRCVVNIFICEPIVPLEGSSMHLDYTRIFCNHFSMTFNKYNFLSP